MAFTDSFAGSEYSLADTMFLYRFFGIFRASRIKTATISKQRANCPLITLNEKTNNFLQFFLLVC